MNEKSQAKEKSQRARQERLKIDRRIDELEGQLDVCYQQLASIQEWCDHENVVTGVCFDCGKNMRLNKNSTGV